MRSWLGCGSPGAATGPLGVGTHVEEKPAVESRSVKRHGRGRYNPGGPVRKPRATLSCLAPACLQPAASYKVAGYGDVSCQPWSVLSAFHTKRQDVECEMQPAGFGRRWSQPNAGAGSGGDVCLYQRWFVRASECVWRGAQPRRA